MEKDNSIFHQCFSTWEILKDLWQEEVLLLWMFFHYFHFFHCLLIKLTLPFVHWLKMLNKCYACSSPKADNELAWVLLQIIIMCNFEEQLFDRLWKACDIHLPPIWIIPSFALQFLVFTITTFNLLQLTAKSAALAATPVSKIVQCSVLLRKKIRGVMCTNKLLYLK